MTNIEKLTAWHRAQVGTKESGVNRVRYNRDYYGRDVEGGDFPWCAAYIWDGFRECGLSSLFLDGGKSAYCPYVVSWARQRGRWVTDYYREGDILLYDWNADGTADHVGYCLSWDGSVATAVEGNVDDCVAIVQRRRPQLIGAYRPDYGGDYDVVAGDDDRPDLSGDGADHDTLPEVTAGATGSLVVVIQRRLMALDYALPQWGADGDFGDETRMAVLALQNDFEIMPDGIVGAETWPILLDRLRH